MSSAEIVVVVVGLVIGYLLVAKLMSRPPQPKVGPNFKSKPEAFDREESASFEDHPGDASWSKVLDVSPAAAVEEIRRAYKVQRSQYHPDKVAALGAELRAVAERKSKEINVAYRQAMRERGVSEQLW